MVRMIIRRYVREEEKAQAREGGRGLVGEACQSEEYPRQCALVVSFLFC